MSSPGKKIQKINSLGPFSQICVKNDPKCFLVVFFTPNIFMWYRVIHFLEKLAQILVKITFFRETKIALQSVTKMLRLRKKRSFWCFDAMVLKINRNLAFYNTKIIPSLNLGTIGSVRNKLRFFQWNFDDFELFSQYIYIGRNNVWKHMQLILFVEICSKMF